MVVAAKSKVPFATELYDSLTDHFDVATSFMHELDDVQGGELDVYNIYFDAGLSLFAEQMDIHDGEVSDLEVVYMREVLKEWKRLGYFFLDFSGYKNVTHFHSGERWEFSEEGVAVNAPVQNIW